MSPPTRFGGLANPVLSPPRVRQIRPRVRQTGFALRLRVRHESAKWIFESATSRARKSLRDYAGVCAARACERRARRTPSWSV